MPKRFLRSDDVTAPDGFCRWCKKPVKRPKRNWCSKECIAEYQIRSSGSTARHAVEKRDHGVCAKCGFDAGRLERILERARNRARIGYGMRWSHQEEGSRARAAYRLVSLLERMAAAGFKVSISKERDWGTWSHLWEADHIVPVVEGGGGCGLDGYRTLCIRCHKKATRELRARLKAAHPV